MKFSRKTFDYFTRAEQNKRNKEWFYENKDFYEENVKAPFEHLLVKIDDRLGRGLPEIKIKDKNVTRPLRPGGDKHIKGAVKNFSFVTLCQKNTSRFEWNPGIHIQFGAKSDDNFYGLGLYMVSSRQMHCLREGLYDYHKTIRRLVRQKKFKDVWGDEFGDRYKRFPNGYDPEDPKAEFLWFKQFYVTRPVSRAQVVRKDFFDQVVSDLKIGLPFFQWIRETVGTYRA